MARLKFSIYTRIVHEAVSVALKSETGHLEKINQDVNCSFVAK